MADDGSLGRPMVGACAALRVNFRGQSADHYDRQLHPWPCCVRTEASVHRLNVLVGSSLISTVEEWGVCCIGTLVGGNENPVTWGGRRNPHLRQPLEW